MGSPPASGQTRAGPPVVASADTGALVATRVPSGLKATDVNGPDDAFPSTSGVPPAMGQTRTDPSRDPVTRRFPSGLTSIDLSPAL